MGKGFFVMFFGWGKNFFKYLFVNISRPIPSINNVQSPVLVVWVIEWRDTYTSKLSIFYSWTCFSESIVDSS